jgi:16S rRNA (guanine527-N7)-methyltransferase
VFADLLRERFPTLTAGQVENLSAHFELMIRWNRSLNLTAVTGPAEALERHYGESLFLASVLWGAGFSPRGASAPLPPGGAEPCPIVDIGSGAGFPGIPIAVLHPEWSVTLVESHQRKAVFLKEATRQMPNVRVLARRVEDVAEEFAWAVSRAVSYSDLRKSLPRLAPHAALLTGAAAPPDELGFDWDAPVAVPGARQRFVRVGRRRAP